MVSHRVLLRHQVTQCTVVRLETSETLREQVKLAIFSSSFSLSLEKYDSLVRHESLRKKQHTTIVAMREIHIFSQMPMGLRQEAHGFCARNGPLIDTGGWPMDAWTAHDVRVGGLGPAWTWVNCPWATHAFGRMHFNVPYHSGSAFLLPFRFLSWQKVWSREWEFKRCGDL